MIQIEYAKRLGISECANIIGLDFVRKYKDNAVACFDSNPSGVLGVSLYISNSKPPEGRLVLGKTEFEYFAEVSVNLKDGSITRGDCRLPS
jgi:hypothetical protein